MVAVPARGCGAFLRALAAIAALVALPSLSDAQEQAPRGAAPELTEQQRLRAQSPGGGLTPGVELLSWPEPANRLARSS